ncbi:hypothetical protein F0L68_21680 [Solihabitans fulvus]|uniref:Uncharacterized protein n=1 Tax=Solihabitans fulvus TaxID=1892852 RepID=A0A5B2X800_9PSEU|nr:hypothetical protein [Solihabitans fulvus]KAA2259537.1 hypothetical protein F0L68_21680 [Solihabitans fulvus]
MHEAFDVVLRGFHKRQVVEHIESMEEQLRFTSMDRAEAMAQAADLRKLLDMTRRDLESTRARLERLELSPATAVGASERLHRMMMLAEDETAELRLRAKKDTDGLRQRVDVEVAELRAKVAKEAKKARETAVRRAAELDQRAVELERLRVDLEAENARRLVEVEAECAAMREKATADAERIRAEIVELATARANFLVSVAGQESRRRIDEARDRIAQLHELHKALAGKVEAARSAIADAVKGIELTPVRTNGVIPEQSTKVAGTTVTLPA